MRRRVRRATTPVTTMILILSLEDLAEEYLTTRGRRGMAGLGSWRGRIPPSSGPLSQLYSVEQSTNECGK
jgi:hypothetical protein